MAYTWHAVDLRSGKRGPRLQTQQRGTVSRIIGEPTDAQIMVLVWDQELGRAVPEWEYWTEPGRMAAVLVDDNDMPLWAGIVLRRIPDETIWLPVALASLEHYFDRRYMWDVTYTGIDQATIAGNIVNFHAATTGVPFVVDAKLTGQLRDRTYMYTDDKTALSVLTDLMNLQDGIEFTVDLAWADTAHTTLQYIFRVGSRIGKSLPQPIRFEYPGPVQSFQIPQDYTRENGANDVQAVSSGQGDTRPQSNKAIDQAKLDAGWVRYERRWTPSTSITEIPTLDSYAIEELAQVRDGLVELSLVANLDTSPRLNVDWWLGDDINVAITAPAFPATRGVDNQVVPGYESIVRVVGWTIDLDARTLTPRLREYDPA